MSQEQTIAAIQAKLTTAKNAITDAQVLVASLAPAVNPVISSLNPNNSPVGTLITVAGSKFGATKGSSTVKFNGTTATVSSWSDTSIIVTVPNGATTGNVVVHVGSLDSNGVNFTVTVAPNITSITPSSANVGTSVTIAGTNFGATQGTSTVVFSNGVTASPTSWSATSIAVPVPAGAVTGTVVITVAGLASNAFAFTVTFGSTVNNDRAIRSFPTLPTLGAAGTFITDPTFGTKIWRVTDANTLGGAAIHTMSNIGGAWNKDGTKFCVSGSGGNAMFFAFDGTNVTYLPGVTIQNQAEPWYSYEDPNAIYSNAYNPVTGSYRLIKRWDLQHGTNSVAADLDALYSGYGMTPGGYIGNITVVDGDVLVVLFGGYGQDSHFLVHHSVLGIVDSRGLVVQATAGNVTGFSMHNIGVDRNGKLFLAPSQADITAHPGIAQIQIYDSATGLLTPLTVAGGGHLQLGFNKMVNQDAQGTYDAAQWQLRSLDTPNSPSNLISPLLSPQITVLSDHTSWQNASATQANPCLSSTFRTDIPLFGSVAQRAWDNEIITIATSGSGEVRRHCHHRNTYDPNDFYSQGHAHVNRAGTHAIFTSNWENTLGTGRQDVFLVELSL